MRSNRSAKAKFAADKSILKVLAPARLPTPAVLYQIGNSIDHVLKKMEDEQGYRREECDAIAKHFLGTVSIPWGDGGLILGAYLEILEKARTLPPKEFLKRMRAGAFDPENQL